MYCGRRWLMHVFFAWLLLLPCLSPAAAQVQALPPSVAPAQRSTLDDATSMAPGQQYLDLNVRPGGVQALEDVWTWQFLPSGLMYPSYLAGGKESRFASHWVFEKDQGWLWDVTLGARVGFLRYGTQDDAWPEGWQMDVEGAAFPRLSSELDRDLVSTDFRIGVPFTVRRGPWEGKLAYAHECSHLGDEFIARYPDAVRINYVRDVLVLGCAFRPTSAVRMYAEAGWAFNIDGGSKPWEFQFGAEYSRIEPSDICGSPFLAVNGRLRQEVDFGGSMTAETGWQWRGRAGRLLRLGAIYFNGNSNQYEFFREHEEQIGMALWYDY